MNKQMKLKENEMMINMSEQLTGFNGEFLTEIRRYDNDKFLDSDSTPNEPPQLLRKDFITLKRICIDSLMDRLEKDTLSGTDKITYYQLASAIHNSEVIDLSPEDIVLLKKRISLRYPPLIVGRAFELLDKKE